METRSSKKRSIPALALMGLIGLVMAGIMQMTLLAKDKETGHAAQVINAGKPGERLDIQKHLAKGKMTIFDFYSVYCPPCVRIGPKLEKLAQKRKDLVVYKLDINRQGTKGIDWQSPLAKQYNLESIPHFKIYDATGKLMAEGDPAAEQIFKWLKDIGE